MVKSKNNPDRELKKNHQNYYFYRSKPITDRELDQLAEELLNEVESTRMLKITSFLTSRRISSYDYYNWVKRHDRLRKAHNIALQVIGERRERGGLEGLYNPTIVLRTLGYYDDSYKAYFDEESKTKDGLNTSPIKVVIKRFAEEE